MSNSLTYQFHLDAAESVRASRHIQRRQRFGRLTWAVWPMLVGLALLYLATGTPWQELWLLGVVAIGLASGHWLLPWLERRRFQRTFLETPGLREPQVYTFSVDGLAILAGAAGVTLGWSAIVEAEESEESFLLYYNRRCAYYLPKRAVGTGAQQDQLRALLREHLGTRAARLR